MPDYDDDSKKSISDSFNSMGGGQDAKRFFGLTSKDPMKEAVRKKREESVTEEPTPES